MKILVIRFSSIGDIVLTTPVIRCLRLQVPQAEIHYATKVAYHPLLSANPNIDAFQLLEKGEKAKAFLAKLKKEGYTHIIDLHNNVRTLRIKRALSQAKAHTFNKLNLEKWLLVNFKYDRMPNVHIVDRYMETVAPLGVKMDLLGLDYFIPEKDRLEWEWIPETHRKGFIAFAIGGQHETKKLPLERIIALCHQINRPIILIGGPEDCEVGEEISAFFNPQSEQEGLAMVALDKRTLVFNACGRCNINQSAWLIQQSLAVFTHDTGMMHIAAAFRKQVFSIWGNTTPKFGMYPYRTRFTVFENNDLSCRPCSKLGYGRCPKGHFKCMNDLKFDFYLPQ